MQTDIEKLVAERAEQDLTPLDRDQMFRDMLDECYPEIECAGVTCSPSKFVEEFDPTVFRCGVNDYMDSISDEWEEINGTEYRKEEVEKIREEVTEEIENGPQD